MASAGLPGTGIGGLFYLVAALFAPFRYVWRRATGKPEPGTAREIFEVAAIALGVMGGIWVAGWLLGVVASYSGALNGLSPRTLLGASTHASNIVRVASVMAGVATLVLVLAAVELARMISRGRRKLATPTPVDGAL
jgi:hypothetical protein